MKYFILLALLTQSAYATYVPVANQGTPAPAPSAWPVYMPSPIPSQHVTVDNFPPFPTPSPTISVQVVGPSPLPVNGVVFVSNLPSPTPTQTVVVAGPSPLPVTMISGFALEVGGVLSNIYAELISIFGNQTNGNQQVKVVNTPTVSISPLPTTSPVPVSIVAPSPLPISGNVSVSNFPVPSPTVTVTGVVSANILSLPSPVPVTVLNFPSPSPTITVTGTVSANILTLPSPVPVTVLNFPSPSPTITVSVAGPSPLPISGNVTVLNFPSPSPTITVAGTVNANILSYPSPVPISYPTTGPSPTFNIGTMPGVSVTNTPTVSISPLPTTSPLPVRAPINANTSLSTRQLVNAGETTIAAPANTISVLVECESGNLDNLRWGFSNSTGSILSSTQGVLCEPGRDTGLLNVSAGNFLHAISAGATTGSDFMDVQWVLSQ